MQPSSSSPSSISGDEVGSRAGDMTLMFAERFPDLYILPTEGTGEASPSLFMLLQDRVDGQSKMGLSENRRPQKFNGPQPFRALKSTTLGKSNTAVAMGNTGTWPCCIGSKSSSNDSFSIGMSRSLGARSVWLCEGTRKGLCQRSAARNGRLPPTQVPMWTW